ncbi:conjugal transfer pilus assembly protein TraF [Rahnella inusitata]|nr:conjugal transfer pilus assembly protein TraF [Rahnella inusitata]
MNLERRKFIGTLLLFCAGLPALAAQPMQNLSALTKALMRDQRRYALLYFVQEGCPYCAKETPILTEFQKQTGWYIKQVDIHQQPEVRTKFNISNTPTIVLISEDMDSRSWQPVSYGFSAADTLVDSIYGITRVLNGEASPKSLRNLVIQGQSTPFSGEE